MVLNTRLYDISWKGLSIRPTLVLPNPDDKKKIIQVKKSQYNSIKSHGMINSFRIDERHANSFVYNRVIDSTLVFKDNSVVCLELCRVVQKKIYTTFIMLMVNSEYEVNRLLIPSVKVQNENFNQEFKSMLNIPATFSMNYLDEEKYITSFIIGNFKLLEKKKALSILKSYNCSLLNKCKLYYMKDMNETLLVSSDTTVFENHKSSKPSFKKVKKLRLRKVR